MKKVEMQLKEFQSISIWTQKFIKLRGLEYIERRGITKPMMKLLQLDIKIFITAIFFSTYA